MGQDCNQVFQVGSILERLGREAGVERHGWSVAMGRRARWRGKKKEKQHSDTLLSAGVLQDGESQGQAIDVILYRMLCSGPPPDQP